MIKDYLLLKIKNIDKKWCKNTQKSIKIKKFAKAAPQTPLQPFSFLQNPSLLLKFWEFCPHLKFSLNAPMYANIFSLPARSVLQEVFLLFLFGSSWF